MARCIRRLLALACALALTGQLLCPPARGVLEEVYFTAVNDDLLELEGDAMPFWSGGQLYVSSAVFTGAYASALGVSYSPGISSGLAVLYSIRSTRTALFFDLNNRLTYDSRDASYTQTARARNGRVFFPLELVASFFGLTYSYTYTDPVPLLRIKSSSAKLTDAMFIDAAADSMRRAYAAYERAMAAPEPEEPEPDPPVVYAGHWVYPIFTVTDSEACRAILDTLNRRDSRAAFLFTREQILADGDLVRMISGQGHAIGLLAAGAGPGEVTASLESAGEALWQAAHLRTRLVWLEESQSAARQAAAAAGYCLMDARLDYRSAPLSSAGRADSVFNRLNSLSARRLTIFFGRDRDNRAGLGRLLSRLGESRGRVLAYRETLG